MALNSINTNIAAYYAQQNIGRASSSASTSIARLSSGNRIVHASDDVAALSAGTSLRTAVTTLKTALINTSQGASLLQVADGALAQITDILQRQKAIAVQAGAGSLSADERSFLNQEFQQLVSEIDRLTGTTNFNGVTLLDGSLFDKVLPETATNNAQQSVMQVRVTAQQNGKTLIFNGVTFTGVAAGPTNVQYLNGNTITEQIDSLVAQLNASTNPAIAGATYSRVGLDTIQITQDAGGTLGRTYTFDVGTYGAANLANTGAAGGVATRFYLQGGNDVGLGFGRTIGVGNVGDNLVLGQSQIKGNNTLTYANTPAAAVVATFNTKTITFAGAAQVFTFTTAPAAATDILIGATVEDTMDNAVAVLANYKNLTTTTSVNRYVFDQLEFSRDGRQIVIERLAAGNVVTDGNAAVTVVTNVAGASPAAAANFNNGASTGISTIGVSNPDFVGTISGFTADFTATPNRVNINLTVGDDTYTALNVDTNVTVNTTVRFTSTSGGYFDVDFAANTGQNVTDQAGANVIAARLDAAFAGLNFYQERNVSDYVGAGSILTNGLVTGSLTGSSFKLQLGDFTEVNLQDIRVTAPITGSTNGNIEFDINGETYRSTAFVGSNLGARGTIRFTNLSNNSEYIEFTGGSQNTFFRTVDEAQALENALKDAFGFNDGGVTLNFQVGTTTEDTLAVSIGNAKSEKLYGGEALDVLTQASAAHASDVIDEALNAVTSIRADVGALQSRFNYASNNIESSLQNQDAARGVLLDTDIATESSAYATAQVQLQAGIAVLAQANLLPQNLLKLIG